MEALCLQIIGTEVSRMSTGSSSDKLGTAAKGSTWTVKGVSGNWVQIQYGSKLGWVYRKYTSIS